MMVVGGEGSDRSVPRHPGRQRNPSFKVAKAFQRPFRLHQPTTWPNWFWWIVTVLWCALLSLLGAGLSVATDQAGFWPMFTGTFVVSLVVNGAVMTWNAYQRRRRNAS